ncbi:nitroreductase family deazaflavin-dependent oxidoreductase [Amycolatopsis antarctica]|uniref:Nitroreductase family deazaflavin-dependent oxidoreductase n=1 Tax=Amycolatopsis antarctica TaxID=1854586 RepID=A0A263D9J2_9PSEU|nr:nitroreductase family deazaflavin-dependent oxidoreductase [Amycolatopsis antarctica]OZM74678.1 nitroreductase family deazaflavin-dependent oxidoreductase [Amycolatopsis antarctica]
MTSDLQDWNSRVIAEFRANAGFVRWSTEEDLAKGRPVPPLLPGFDRDRSVPVILVSHTGATTGRRRTSPLVYLPVGDAFAIFATYGGSPRPPAWYGNMVRNPRVTVEVGAEVAPARARVTHGSERERMWTEQVRLMPAFTDFEAAAGRQIPVLVLDRVADTDNELPS